MNKKTLLIPCTSALLAAGVVYLVGCGGPAEPDPSAATSQGALAALAACGLDDGSIDADAHLRACDPQDVKKTTICHIPPGNPANAHTICVGNAAVSHHIKNHGDYVGACQTETPCPPPSSSGGASGGGGASGTGGVTGTDAGPPATTCPDGQAVCASDPSLCPNDVGTCTNGCCVPWIPF